jgi:hypothetical protein
MFMFIILLAYVISGESEQRSSTGAIRSDPAFASDNHLLSLQLPSLVSALAHTSRMYKTAKIARLRAELARTKSLLLFAEDLLLAFQSGLFPPAKPAEGVWGQERDRAGLRAASNRRELGESGEYGKTFFLRVRPFALPASLLPLLSGSSLDMVFRLSRPLVDNLRRLPLSHLPSFSLLFTLQSAFLPLPTRRAPPSRCFLPQRRLASAQVSRSPLPSQHDLARDRFAFALPRPWPVVVSCYARYLLPTCKPTFCISSSRL